MINLVVSLIECRLCSKQYVGSTTTPFRNRFNNYKNGARKVPKVCPKKCNVYQEEFHRQFNSEGHNGMEDWKITIIDRAEKVLELMRRESYWQHRLSTFIPNGLNESFVGIHSYVIICFTFLQQTFISIIWILTAVIWTRFPGYP